MVMAKRVADPRMTRPLAASGQRGVESLRMTTGGRKERHTVEASAGIARQRAKEPCGEEAKRRIASQSRSAEDKHSPQFDGNQAARFPRQQTGEFRPLCRWTCRDCQIAFRHSTCHCYLDRDVSASRPKRPEPSEGHRMGQVPVCQTVSLAVSMGSAVLSGFYRSEL